MSPESLELPRDCVVEVDHPLIKLHPWRQAAGPQHTNSLLAEPRFAVNEAPPRDR